MLVQKLRSAAIERCWVPLATLRAEEEEEEEETKLNVYENKQETNNEMNYKKM